MERLPKFAIYLGMVIGMTVFVLFLVSGLPYILEQSINNWERLDRSDASEEEIRAKFAEHPSYVAMYERFPDAREEFSYREGDNGMMSVGVMNFDNGNRLMLNMYYNAHDDRINVSADCNADSDSHRQIADGLFAEDFIRNTNCLELEYDSRQVETQDTVTVLPD